MDTKLYKIMILIVILTMVTPTVAFGQATVFAGDPVTSIDLVRSATGEANLGDLVADSMRWKADMIDDNELNNSIDLALIESDALLADIPAGSITTAAADDAIADDTLYLVSLTGAQVQSLLDGSARLTNGLLQISGGEYFWYNDTGDTTATTWGAYGVKVEGQALVREKVYKVVVNDALVSEVVPAPETTPELTSDEVQQAFYDYTAMLGTVDAFNLDRITQLDNVVTILHTNDVHGDWQKTSYKDNKEGMVYLATLIARERAHNPNVLLLDGGDTFQGNSYAYFFRNMSDNAISQGLNWLGYDAMVLGNHEYNFGPETFAAMLGQLDFPILGSANLDDDGSYGFINDHVQDYTTFVVNGIKVSVFGLTNPRVYRYELPSNIPGLTFYPVMDVTQPLVDQIRADENPDVLVGLTHIGYHGSEDEPDSDDMLAENVTGLDIIVGSHSHSTISPAKMFVTDANPNGVLVAQTGSHAQYLGKIDIGFIDGKEALREGYLIPANEVAEPDAALSAFMEPYVQQIEKYNSTIAGTTTVPLDALNAYTEETNGANLQADAAVWAVEDNGVDVDFHLSGAMSNRKIADSATPENPFNVTRGDLFELMPYENSLVVMSMNGPQIKEILERGFRNWYYYQYVPRSGGYSHYTTCMLTTEAGNQISYRDPYPALPDGDNVLSMVADGKLIDFDDADTYYNVSSVNYIVAGSCNFNNDGQTIWPLDQIVADTQYYVRDSVTNYLDDQEGPIAPAIEGRLTWLHTGICPTTDPKGIGYWKNHTGRNTDCVTSSLPVMLGMLNGEKSVTVSDVKQAVSLLKMDKASNGIEKLYAQLLTAKLNIANGVNNHGIAETVYAADTFLSTHNAAAWKDLSKSDQQMVLQWMELLDQFNNGY